MHQLDLASPAAPADRWVLVRDGLAVVALGLAALCTVVLFLPAEGRVAAALHEALGALLGRAAFMLPVALAVMGVLLLVRSVRPGVRLPWSRLCGLGVLAACVVAIEAHLEPNGGGALGAWFAALLQDWLGAAGTAIVLVAALLVGTLLTFQIGAADVARAIRARRPSDSTATVSPGAPVKVSPWVFAVPRWRPLPRVPREQHGEGVHAQEQDPSAAG